MMSQNQIPTEPLKRHCMIVHAYYPIGEPRVEREATALVSAGFEVDILCLQNQDEPREEMIDGVRIYRLPVKRHKGKGIAVQLAEYLTFFLLSLYWVTRLHLKQRYSVVQVHNLPDFLIFSALVPKLMGARLILDLHDLMPEFYAGRFEKSMDGFPIRVLRFQEWLSCGFADQVITVTGLWRETLINRGVRPEKIHVVMNVANDKIFQRHLRSMPALSDGNAFSLIYHGNLAHRYGIDIAIEAISLLKADIPGIHFTIHGRGEYLDALQEKTRDLNLEDHIDFSTQYVPTHELPALISSAHVGLVPYRKDVFTDGILPTKMMEYVVMGIPVIAASTTAISNYFNSDMVRFFQPGDAFGLANCILSLYHNQEQLALLAANADRFNEQYNWKKVASGYVANVMQLNYTS